MLPPYLPLEPNSFYRPSVACSPSIVFLLHIFIFPYNFYGVI